MKKHSDEPARTVLGICKLLACCMLALPLYGSEPGDRTVPTPDTASAGPEIVERSEDLRRIIDSALAAGDKLITIRPGRYRVKPRNCEHLSFRGLKDIEIVADGVEMICTETTRAITIENCANLKIRGMTIDHAPLPYTQGRIVNISSDKRTHEIRLTSGYPDADKVWDSQYEIFDGETRILRFGSYHQFKSEVVSPRRIRVTRGGNYMGEKVGDIIAIVISHAPGGRIPHAIVTSNSRNVVLQDITLYASNCFGFFEVGCTATHYLRCRIDRRPLETDYRKRGEPRIRSLDADAFHSKHAIVGPTLENCTAKFMADDCVNICGDYHMIMESDGSTLRVLAKHHLNIEEGDPLEIVSYDGSRLPDSKALKVSGEMGSATAEELEFLSKQRMHEPFRKGELGRIFEIKIDDAVDLPMGSVVAAANRMGNGFKVIGCDFGFNRSRGVLIKASHGVVKDNRIEGSWGEAVKIAPEYWWLESGSSNDVKVVGNTIINCMGKGIAVYAIPGEGGIAPAGAHNDIVIENNIIKKTEGDHLWITSTKGLVLRNNKCVKSKSKLENCEDVRRKKKTGSPQATPAK